MPKPQIAIVWVFASESKPGATYQTILYIDGATSCECPGWKFRKRTLANGARTCKHTRYVDMGMAEQHALSSVEYAKPERGPKQRAAQVPPEKLPGQNTMDFAPRRVFSLED